MTCSNAHGVLRDALRCRPRRRSPRLLFQKSRMPAIAFDRFYRYADLTAIPAARSPPNIRSSSSIESIGKSHEGRDIWVVTVTNAATGPAVGQAGLLGRRQHPCDRGRRVRPRRCISCNTLVTQYGNDPDITRALDTRAFYICPRINPDGAEWALADKPKLVRSQHASLSVRRGGDRGPDRRGHRRRRAHPADAHRRPQRRVEDASGASRGLMVRREPAETGGTYYRILPEGTRRGLRRLHAARQEDEAGARPQPQFSGELAPGVRAARRGPVSDVGARGARRGGLHHAPPEHHRRDVASTPGAACCCARSSTSPTTRCTPRTCGSTRQVGRQGHRAHRLSARSPSITNSAITRNR